MVVSKFIEEFKVRDKRLIFQAMRSHVVSDESFFPTYGITVGEFSIWHILSESNRTKRK